MTSDRTGERTFVSTGTLVSAEASGLAVPAAGFATTPPYPRSRDQEAAARACLSLQRENIEISAAPPPPA